MKIWRNAIALLIATALFASVAVPAHAEPTFTPISNTIKAAFQVTGPSFVIKWVDTNDNNTLKDTLPSQTVAAGSSKQVTVKATVSETYNNVQMSFKIKRLDGDAQIAASDVDLQEIVSGTSGNVRTGYVSDGMLNLTSAVLFLGQRAYARFYLSVQFQ